MDDKTSLATSIQGLCLYKKKSDLNSCISPAVVNDESPLIIRKLNKKLSSSTQHSFMLALKPMATNPLTPTLKSMKKTLPVKKSSHTIYY